MDAESQVRPVLGRMALDFAQMIKRTDVDYYAKSNLDNEPGNDRIAFFCKLTGLLPFNWISESGFHHFLSDK